MSEKKFLDTVHGYISVPEKYCDKLIDTKNFQRLRRIEQTSARSLYPCARHDRFVHSLGVYHLGRKFVQSITRQIEVSEALQQTFLIACLLHDCGHSPFSHTLEDLFGETKDLFQIYVENITGRSLDKTISEVDITKLDTKPHEVLSALLCVTEYYESIIELGGNPSLVGRMIMGIPYYTIDHSLEDCFISLLHGDVIDTDKLDYICRDKWASGYLADSVDLDRLIDAVVIYQDREGWHRIAYHKSCINEIQALMDSKNFQSNWVFKHHQVVYEQMLLKESVKELVECLKPEHDLPASQLFNYKAFYDKQTVYGNIEIYLPADDDIVSLMKTHHNQIPHLDEWLSRSYVHFPLWKSYSEMKAILGSERSEKVLNNNGSIYDAMCKCINDLGFNSFSLEATPSMKVIKKGKVMVKFDEDTYVDFADLNVSPQNNIYENQTFKYIFVGKVGEPKRKDIIENLKKLVDEI